jgi:hypothetical protein
VRLSVSPAVVAAGGAINVGWSGIRAPTGWDELRLYRLGERSDDLDHGTWPASGTANGARTIVLPGVVARSQPIYVGP